MMAALLPRPGQCEMVNEFDGPECRAWMGHMHSLIPLQEVLTNSHGRPTTTLYRPILPRTSQRLRLLSIWHYTTAESMFYFSLPLSIR